MSEAKLTLNTLFGLPDEKFYTKALSAGMSKEGLVTTKEKILSALRGLRWRAIETEFRDKAVDLLNMDVLDLVTSTWEKYNTLAELADRTKANNETAFVPLMDHSIDCELHPYVEIRMGSFVQQIVFDVTAEIKMKGLILKIGEGKIKAIEAGSCEGDGEIKIKELTLREQKFGPLNLPGTVNLGNGIALA